MSPMRQLDYPTNPTVGDWITGSRPVALAAGACALLVVVCGWFAAGESVFGSSSDVGTPAPVHFGNSEPATRDSGAAVAVRPESAAPHRGARPQSAASIAKPGPPQDTRGGTRSEAPAPAADTSPTAKPPTRDTAPDAAPTSEPLAPQTTPLPLQVEPPAVSLPPTPQLSVEPPQLPQVEVPAVPAVSVPVPTPTLP